MGSNKSTLQMDSKLNTELNSHLLSSDKFNISVGDVLTLETDKFPYPPFDSHKVVYPDDVTETEKVLYQATGEGGRSNYLSSYKFNKPGNYILEVIIYGSDFRNKYLGDTKYVIVNVSDV